MKKILQVFKKLFHKEHALYICDPSKAMDCAKTSCWDINKGPCKCTAKKKYAKLDVKGKPIIATQEDFFNFEWIEEQLPLLYPDLIKPQEKQG